jgi:hypothetical protein
VVVLKISVFWDIVPYSALKVNLSSELKSKPSRNQNEADNKQSSALNLLSVDYIVLYPKIHISSSSFYSYSTACNILHTTT